MSSPQRVTITRPDDWHVHLRDGPALAAVVAATADSFARAIVMPNLKPPVTSVAAAAAYRDRIRAALPAMSWESQLNPYTTGKPARKPPIRPTLIAVIGPGPHAIRTPA